MSAAPVISAHDAFASASCVEQGCPFEAEPYSDRCRDHGQRRRVDKRTAKWTAGAIVAAIRAYAETHGYPPSSHEWRASTDDHPNANLVKRVFGSWSEAVVAAGFERPVRGRSAKSRPLGAAVEERDPKAEEHPLDEAAPTSTEATGAASATPAGRSPSRSSTADLAAFAVALIVGLRGLADALEESLAPSRNGFSDLSEPGATS